MLQHVLDALGDEYVSGEMISRRLGKSRTAVWHWIAELKAAGYEIEASPRKGYRLLSRPDRLYPWEVVPKLQTSVLGHRYEYREQIPSTNDLAKEMAREGAPEGLVVVAEEQTKGRGRRGRGWLSPFGSGLWMSLVLRPETAPRNIPTLALVSALGVAYAIEEVTGLTASVKWPNDVLVADQKVCGILVEMEGELEAVRHVVVGIGVNVNMDREALPLEARATSLRAEAKKTINRAALCVTILSAVEKLYEVWCSEGFGALRTPLREKLASLHRPLTVVDTAGDWHGIGVDVAADGSLLIRREDGRIVPVYAADVSLRTSPIPAGDEAFHNDC